MRKLDGVAPQKAAARRLGDRTWDDYPASAAMPT